MDQHNQQESSDSVVHWQRTRRLSLQLLLVWLGATMAVVFFARELAGINLFGWPLSFYLAAQGILLLYLAIVIVYVWRMRRLDDSNKENRDAE